MSSSLTQPRHLPKDGTAHSMLGPLQWLAITKTTHRHGCRSLWRRQLLTWGFLSSALKLTTKISHCRYYGKLDRLKVFALLSFLYFIGKYPSVSLIWAVTPLWWALNISKCPVRNHTNKVTRKSSNRFYLVTKCHRLMDTFCFWPKKVKDTMEIPMFQVVALGYRYCFMQSSSQVGKSQSRTR